MSELKKGRTTVIQLLFRLLFEVVPTIAIAYVTLAFLNQSYTTFETGLSSQALYLGIGITLSYTLYFFRTRVWFTLALLFLSYWIIDKLVSNLPGEFDVFYAVAKFKLYSTLFIGGWIFGFLLARWKWASILIGGMLSIFTFISVSDTLESPLQHYMFTHLIPVITYMLYMLFMAPVLTDLPDLDLKRSGKVLLRGLFFLVFILGIFFWQTLNKMNEIKAVEKILDSRNGKGNKPGGESDGKYDQGKGLLEKGDNGKDPDKGKDKGKYKGDDQGDDGDGGYRLKDTMTMGDQMSQADFIMFCAKLKNYFPNGSPKPLYFVYHYLTKFDPVKESFIRDTAMPFFDEMKTDPSTLPMYRSKVDSSVIKNSLATKKRKVVESEVYISSNTWKHAILGPAGTYSCQTIPVDSTYKKMFRSAYKIKSYVSDLNNAYFVYNPSANPMLEDMQEQRFSELRTVKNYTAADPKLMSYYTTMPKGPLFDSIHALSLRITQNAKTPIDKIIAIRDYFMARDKNGNRIYRYSLKAGVPSDPNIPNSSMLRNFLFKTHTGYCTYFAGASLLMLRSLGIPSRFTTGFATIDRADKNKGWYWFYASQAHAWTQVYFPGYGWLDFDMTIGNDDQKESPQPDGTPPLPPPEPWLVIEGRAVIAPDAKSKHLDVSFNKINFFNEDYHLDQVFTRDVDASVCRVMYGNKDTTLSAIHAGDSIFVVSYDDAAKVVPQPRTGVKIEIQVEEFPKPVIADEIHIVPKQEKEEKRPELNKKNKANEKPLTWKQILVRVLYIALAVALFTILLPLFWMWFLLLRMRSSRSLKTRADRAYRLALFHFHMSGVERGAETPLQYASDKVDRIFTAGFAGFMAVYLRLKYAGGELIAGDEQIISGFSNNILRSARLKLGFFTILANYTNLFRANRFFRRPLEEKEESENKNKPNDGPILTASQPE